MVRGCQSCLCAPSDISCASAFFTSTATPTWESHVWKEDRCEKRTTCRLKLILYLFLNCNLEFALPCSLVTVVFASLTTYSGGQPFVTKSFMVLSVRILEMRNQRGSGNLSVKLCQAKTNFLLADFLPQHTFSIVNHSVKHWIDTSSFHKADLEPKRSLFLSSSFRLNFCFFIMTACRQ